MKKENITVGQYRMFLLLLTFFLLLPVVGWTYQFPDTGQNKCYNNSGEIICSSPRQAFYGQDAQYSTNARSYTKLDALGNALSDDATSWTMVRDNVTGLIWENKTADGTIHDGSKAFTWCDTNSAINGGNQGICGTGTGDAATDTEAFINALNAANYGGYSDWRMPTVKELSTLVNSAIPEPGPTIDAAWFPNTQSAYFSSTTDSSNSDLVWVVLFNNGFVAYVYKTGFGSPVRAVRGEQTSSNLVDNGDGTVTDTSTGLMWQKATASGTYTWEQALAYCKNLNLAGYTDWRLPNRNELQSLVDYSRHLPAIDPLLATATATWYYWSSTTYAYSNNYAWDVNFMQGHIYGNYRSKSDSYSVRAVRAGQAWSFTFTNQIRVALSTRIESNVITVTSITAPTSISVTGGEYSVSTDGGSTWSEYSTSVPATVNLNDQFKVRQTSSSSYFTTTNAVLTIGGASDTFSVTTGGLAYPFPDTGQTKCYNNDAEIPCPSPGQAFYGQDAQYNLPSRSYTKLDASGNALHSSASSWTIVRDNVTGLSWEMKTDDNSIHDKDKTFTWCDTNPATNGGNQGTCGTGTGDAATDTEAFINALNSAHYGGYSDWRMPTFKELHTLVNSSVENPAIDTAWFPYTEWLYYGYWSSTTYNTNSSAFRMFFTYIYGSSHLYDFKSNSNYVRAVRGELTSSNLVDNGDGTVTDTASSLMWQKATAPGTHTWEQGLAYCENLDLAGYTDWRLPNRNELLSLVDYSRVSPSIKSLLIADTVSSYYWSSTTFAYSNIHGAWSVGFNNGGFGSDFKSNSNYVRAVRAGQPWLLTDQTGVPLSTVVISNTITVSGIAAASPISIIGGEYSVSTDGGTTWSEYSTSVPATVNLNDQVRLRQTSSADYSTTTNAVLTIGGVSDTFSVTTIIKKDTTPNQFTFVDQTNMASNMAVISNTITVIGINTATSISITGGEYSVSTDGGSTWSVYSTSVPATVNLNDQVRVRQTSSSSYFTQTDVTLTIGGLFDTFRVTTGGSAYPFSDTGQTKCYSNSSEITLTCPSPGQPFYGQDAQYNLHPRSYTKFDASGNALPDDATSWTMVRDNVTGLIWEMKTDDNSIHDKDKTFTWCDTNPATNGGNQGTCGTGTGDAATDTEAFINALNSAHYGGYSDWRLPTIKELSTLVNSSSVYPPAIDAAWFPNTVSSGYWSSTTHANYNNFAWSVYFYYGYIFNFNDNKSYYYYVRAVRGGQTSSNLVDNGNGTVTDTATGLMWQKATAPGTYTWEQALAYCDNLDFAGNTDWRLPDRNELQSLVDYSRDQPAIDILFADDTVGSNYWSSTTYANNSNRAWIVYFSYGFVSSYGKSDYYYVRAVRAGQPWLFTDQADVALSTVVISNTITVTGINAATSISITGGEYSVSTDGGSTWSEYSTAVPVTVNLNDQVRVRQTSSGEYSTTTNATLTIGGVSDTFSVTTVKNPALVVTITVDSNPDSLNAPWTLTGPNAFSHSFNGDAVEGYLEPGEYTVTWGAVAEWDTPAAQTQTLAAGDSFTFTGTYNFIISNPPTSGAQGSNITINGSNFGATQGGGYVDFNGIHGTIVSWSDTQIVVTVPYGATTGCMTVVTDYDTSDCMAFTVLACGNSPAWVAGYYFNTIQLAVDNAADGDTIKLQPDTFGENVLFNRNIETILRGGYNCPYDANPGYSTIDGSLTITNGTTTVEKLIIK